MYGSATTDTNIVSQLTIPRSGVITSMLGIAYSASGLVAGGALHWEVSFSSSRNQQVNDALGPIFSVVLAEALNTSGGGLVAVQNNVVGVAIPVRENDRIYLHLEVDGTAPATSYCKIYLYVAE